MLTVAKLRRTLRQHEQVVRRALDALFPSPDAPLSLDAIALGVEEDDGEDLADLLLATLNELQKVPHLVSYLRARGADPLPRARNKIFTDNIARFNGIVIGTPAQRDFDLTALSAFASRASSFRCRIAIDDIAEGSGAFVAPNLVLTAAHVLDGLQTPVNGVARRLGIYASDGAYYPATCARKWLYHPNEPIGELPTGNENDIALLRVYMPLGQVYGLIDVTAAPPDFIGPEMFTLVHYPDGQETGFVSGAVRRDEPGLKRLPHDIDTSGGSSGGPGFDRTFRFLGVHQGRWENVRRLVPYEQFRDDEQFRRLVWENFTQRDMWALDRNIEGPLIIGRRQFVSGLAAMLENPASRLRGIWIRREDTASLRGLGFSFDMLEAYLLMHENPNAALEHRCIRMTPTLATSDLLADLSRAALDAPTPGAKDGTGQGQTTDVAFEDSRATLLIDAMNMAAAAAGQTWWVFFDNPPNGLTPHTQLQFEHIARHLPVAENLRLILAGYETYRLAPLRFTNVGQADSARRSGLLVEELGPFTRGDVEATLNTMIRSLDPEKELTQARLREMTDKALNGLVADATGQFPGTDLDQAVREVRLEAKAFLGFAP